jgi:hypothetical protein
MLKYMLLDLVVTSDAYKKKMKVKHILTRTYSISFVFPKFPVEWAYVMEGPSPASKVLFPPCLVGCVVRSGGAPSASPGAAPSRRSYKYPRPLSPTSHRVTSPKNPSCEAQQPKHESVYKREVFKSDRNRDAG